MKHRLKLIAYNLLLLLLLISATPIIADNNVPTTKQEPIEVVNAPGTNVVLNDRLDNNHIVVDVTTKAHDWWMMKLTGVKGKTVSIGFSMEYKGDVAKWHCLQPVYTYSDPDKLQSYLWYTKEKGHWMTGNTLFADKIADAGTNKCPIQHIIPAESAGEFLDSTGSYWESWGRIKQTEVIDNLDIFRFTASFSQNAVWIAMRYPFSNELFNALLEKVKNLHNDAIRVKVIGKSEEHRDLSLIEVDTSRFFQRHPLQILVYGREHATEPATSWGVVGILQSILDNQIDQWPQLALIPIMDPDSVAKNLYEGNVIQGFGKLVQPIEVISYENYVKEQTTENNNINVAISLNNVEASEAGNLWMPHYDFLCPYKIIKLLCDRIYQMATREGYSVSDNMLPEATHQSNRFEGWLGSWGCIDMTWEVNDQAKDHQLNLKQLAYLGANMVKAIDRSKYDDQW